MTAPRELASVQDYGGLLDAIRARQDECNVSTAWLDDRTGLDVGYSAKLLAQVKHLGPVSLGLVLQALGLRLGVFEVVPAHEVAAASEQRNRSYIRARSISTHMERRAKQAFGRYASVGGRARAKSLPAWRRSQLAKKARRAGLGKKR